MKCPACQSDDTGVYNSRPLDGRTWRRRKCNGCGECFSTLEVIAQADPEDRRRVIPAAADESLALLQDVAGAVQEIFAQRGVVLR